VKALSPTSKASSPSFCPPAVSTTRASIAWPPPQRPAASSQPSSGDRLRGETKDVLIAGHFYHLPRLRALLVGGSEDDFPKQ
jgi:hypothetical protein